MQTPDILSALKPVIQSFEELDIPYYIGGSVASSVYGMARATLDVDIIADIKTSQITGLKKNLEGDFYIDADMIADAIGRTSSFNLIHLDTMLKIDVFIHKNEPYQNKVLERKIKDTFEEGEQSAEFYFSSPEDIIINKLQWYEMGGKVSERQWLDVTGVIKVQGNLLDEKYLQDWSEKLELLGLLEKAYMDAGLHL
jgi:hypothetical protein